MITRIRLKNWKSHLDSEFEFVKGVNALVGINGAGKSSVLDGISFALFGTFPNHANRKVSLDDLIMERPQQKDEAEVELDFLSNEKKYTVLRKLKRGKGTVQAEIREGGNLIEVNPNNVTGHIERILEIDYPLFSKAVYSEQNNIDYFLTIPKGKRMQHIDKMLKLERFESVREAGNSIKNSISLKRGEKIRLLAELKKDDVEGNANKIKTGIENGHSRLENIKKDLYGLMEDRERTRSRVSDLEGKEKKIIDFEKNLEGLKSAHREVVDSLNEKSKIPVIVSKEEMLVNIESLKKDASQIESEIKNKKEFLEISRNHAAASNIEIRAINEGIRELEKVGAKCPICEGDVGEDKKKLLASVKLKRIDEIKSALNSAVKEVGSIREQIEKMEDDVKKKNKEIERMNYKLEDFDIVGRMRNKVKIIELDMENIKKEMASALDEIKGIDIKLLRSDLEEKNRKVGELQTLLVSLEDSIRKDSVLLADLEKRLEIIRKYEMGVEASLKIVNFMDNFLKAVGLTQEQMREEFTKTVNYIMGKIWNGLYPYGDFTDIRLGLESGDYALEIKTGDSWIAVDGFASGGERSLACLALRVAFSMAFIPDLRWLILDEPTHNLDANTIQKFSSVLRENLSSIVNQIFLITHEERVVEDVEGPVYKLKRDKEANGATQVIKI